MLLVTFISTGNFLIIIIKVYISILSISILTLIEKNNKIAAEMEVSQLIHTNLPLRLLSQIDDYVRDDPYGKRNDSRSSAVRELLTVGLWFAKKRHEFEAAFKNPELMEELQTQLHEGGLVDYIQRMKWQEFQVVWSIFKTEAKSRKMS